VPRIAERSRKPKRNAIAIVVGLLVASSVACSLFVSVDGLQNGAVDSDATSNDVFVAQEAASIDRNVVDAISNVDASSDASTSAGPFAFVQATDFDPPDGGSGDMTLAPVVPGHSIIVCVTLNGTATPSVSDDKGDTFHLDVGPIGVSVGSPSYIFSAIGVPGNEQKIHVTISGAAADTELYALEYSGLKAFDVGTGAAYATGTSLTSGYVTTAVADELLVAFAEDGTVTPSTDFVAHDTANEDVVESRIAGAPGTYSATVTTSGGGIVLIGAYR
jgi:hypothetical protein